MTRDYNNQPRDDMHPSSRNQSSNRPGDEQSPRPARPRLNRETVDRAWESGAPNKHADYRPRSGGNSGQPPRNNWRNNQQSGHSSAPQGRRPFDNRQDSNRSFERTPNSNQGPRPQSFDPGRSRYDNQRFNSRPGAPGGPSSNGARSDFRDNPRPYSPRPNGQRAPFRDNDQGRGYQRRDTAGAERPPRDFDRARDSRPPRSFERQPREFGRDNRSPRSFERQPREFGRDNRSQRTFERGNRPDYNGPQRNTENPRWQSRPAIQRDSSFRERPDFNDREPQHEQSAPQQKQFEGDYERFDAPESQKRPSAGRPFQGSDTPSEFRAQPEERHVTRLPDGRVLKGPRPAQRKNAQFWTEVANESGSLVERVESTPTEEQAEQPVEVQRKPSVKEKSKKIATPRKPRARAASAVSRGKMPPAKRKSAVKPRSTGPKPSKRGFKWPTP
ncbi:MAG TPA: hypothetical protein VK140_14310 [Ktedonobacteraceae bacterium]|nr:hypothetical protein [Ktedonobacteraceae bacterium]